MVELANGKPDSALLTLTPMEPYCTACMRYIDTIHLKVLTAIALYQKRDEAWREPLTAALALAEEYRFIRTVSVYGAAVLPLLDALEWLGNAKWHKRLMADVRAQAAIYPPFFAAKAFHERGTDGSGDAGAAADLRGQEQCGDPEHPGLHGQEPCEQRAQ